MHQVGRSSPLGATVVDGVVSFASSHVEGVASEVVVESDHMDLTRHPLSVLEVRRILLTHLAELDGPPRSPLERPPMTAGVSGQQPFVPGVSPSAPAVQAGATAMPLLGR